MNRKKEPSPVTEKRDPDILFEMSPALQVARLGYYQASVELKINLETRIDQLNSLKSKLFEGKVGSNDASKEKWVLKKINDEEQHIQLILAFIESSDFLMSSLKKKLNGEIIKVSLLNEDIKFWNYQYIESLANEIDFIKIFFDICQKR